MLVINTIATKEDIMKKKNFIQLKIEMLSAMSSGKKEKAQKLKQKLYQAIFDRKAQGKDTGTFNFH